ncbi:MAG: hypothetical protein L7S47_06950 [Acidimicrobiales bacterium]|nr:hypothetical protein [Acidimicrobiales bacterium]
MMIAEESGLAANSAMVSGLGLTALVGFGVINFESYLRAYPTSFTLTLNQHKRQLKRLATNTAGQLLIEVHHNTGGYET